MPSWLAALDRDDQVQFFLQMGAALQSAERSRDTESLETCLREWRVTAQALSDPLRRAVLTGAGDDDYEEVARP
jgi:hypothetical protein